MQGNQCMVDTFGVIRVDKKHETNDYGRDNYIGYHSSD